MSGVDPEREREGEAASSEIVIFLSLVFIFHLLTHPFIHFLSPIPAQALEAQIYETSPGL